MIKCSEIKELISLYIDNELEPEQRSKLEEHTEACEECRNELMELKQIVELCRNITEEELPANFKAELHQKLLEAKEQSEAVQKSYFYKNRYFRALSSAAAVLLLIFLVRGVGYFDLFRGVQTKSANEIYNMAADTVADEQLQMKAAAPAQGFGSLMDTNAGSKEGKATDAYSYANGTEIDRSTTQPRDSKMIMAVAGTGETITRNSASIVITVDDPEAQAERVKLTAMESTGLDQIEIQPTAASGKALLQDEGVILQISVPSIQYDEFINALYRDYGRDNVQAGAVMAEDMTDTVENLLYEVDRLDELIENAEDDNGENSEELVKMREQKAEIQSLIDSLRLESDLTNVEIKLKKK